MDQKERSGCISTGFRRAIAGGAVTVATLGGGTAKAVDGVTARSRGGLQLTAFAGLTDNAADSNIGGQVSGGVSMGANVCSGTTTGC